MTFITFGLLLSASFTQAKKIKHSFSIEKSKDNDSKSAHKRGLPFIGREINLTDSSDPASPLHSALLEQLKECSFAGYDKEPNSNIESFIFINSSHSMITGYRVRIDYLDMKGRMLHSREIKDTCSVPPNQTRRFDIKSWDKQHTYYYYLGNRPKRVATPFQVKFTPFSFWVCEP